MSPIRREKSFRNIIQSNRYQIVFSIFRLIWNQRDAYVWFQINRRMVNTVCFQVDLIRFRKDFSVYGAYKNCFPNYRLTQACLASIIDACQTEGKFGDDPSVYKAHAP